MKRLRLIIASCTKGMFFNSALTSQAKMVYFKCLNTHSDDTSELRIYQIKRPWRHLSALQRVAGSPYPRAASALHAWRSCCYLGDGPSPRQASFDLLGLPWLA